jgi:hypothetical protein
LRRRRRRRRRHRLPVPRRLPPPDAYTRTLTHTPSPQPFSSFLASHLPSLRASSPHLDVALAPRPGRHPYLRADYVNGTSRTQCVRGLDGAGVAAAARALRDCVGRKASLGVPARRHVPAVRGPGGEAIGVQGGWRAVEGGGG